MTTGDENRPTRRRITLTGISSRAWEHPADRGALTALRELRGFDDVVKAFFGMWNERGFRLSDDVIGYLLAHGRRDMPTLVATLAALDRHSLATQRPITVPLLRDWLQHDLRLTR